MRRVVMALLPVLIACASKDVPPKEDAAVAPAGLTEAEVAGVWTGVVMPEGSDSVVARWTMDCAGGACKLTTPEAPDTVTHAYTLSGDSMVGTSEPFSDPSVGPARVRDHWVGRLVGGRVVGTGRYVLEAKPDSVVFRYRFEGGRK